MSSNSDKWIFSLKVEELKAELTVRNEPIVGLKPDLVARLVEVLNISSEYY